MAFLHPDADRLQDSSIAYNVSSMDDVLVRPATLADVPAIVDLLRALFAIEADFMFDEAKQMNGVKMLLERQEEACVLVAVSQEQVVDSCLRLALGTAAEHYFLRRSLSTYLPHWY
jgi:hypothetical protein